MREASLLASYFRWAKALSWSFVFGCELDLAVEVVPTMAMPERKAAPLMITAAMAKQAERTRELAPFRHFRPDDAVEIGDEGADQAGDRADAKHQHGGGKLGLGARLEAIDEGPDHDDRRDPVQQDQITEPATGNAVLLAVNKNALAACLFVFPGPLSSSSPSMASTCKVSVGRTSLRALDRCQPGQPQFQAA